ncbi:hypothetical protein Agub_g6743, partial [Astrephomene gubernaculifera]
MRERNRRRKAARRRPTNFWVEFNNWARNVKDTEGGKPRVQAIWDWYTENANTVWPDPRTRPTFEQAKRHAKGIRAKSAIRDYFRDYRRRKGEEEGAQEQEDSSDDDDDDEDYVGAVTAPVEAPGGRPQRARCKPLRFRSSTAAAAAASSHACNGSVEGARDDDAASDEGATDVIKVAEEADAALTLPGRGAKQG